MPPEAAIIYIPTNLGASRKEGHMGDVSIAAFPSPLVDVVLRQNGLEPVEHVIVRCPKPNKFDTTRVKNLDAVVELSSNVAGIVEEQRRKGRVIVAIGGDHSLSLGTVPGVVAAESPEAGNEEAEGEEDEVGMIVIDRHLDYHTEETTPSGNIHGEVLAANTGSGNRHLTNIHRPGRKLKAKNVFVAGVNDADADAENPENGELERADADCIGVMTMDEFNAGKRSMGPVRARITALAKRVKKLIVSIDTDGIDQRDAPANHMLNPDGFRADEAVEIMNIIRETGAEIVAVEVVETGLPLYTGAPMDMRAKEQYVTSFPAQMLKTSMLGLRLVGALLKR